MHGNCGKRKSYSRDLLSLCPHSTFTNHSMMFRQMWVMCQNLPYPWAKTLRKTNLSIFPTSPQAQGEGRHKGGIKAILVQQCHIFMSSGLWKKKGEEKMLLLGQQLVAFALNLTRAKYGMKCVTNERHKSIHAGNLQCSGIHSLHINNSFCSWRLCLWHV